MLPSERAFLSQHPHTHSARRFPSGVIAHASCSLGSAESRHLQVVAREGTIDIANAFAYQGLEMKIKRAGKLDGKPGETIEPKIEEKNQFATEIDAFARAILDNKAVRTPGEDGLADMRVIADRGGCAYRPRREGGLAPVRSRARIPQHQRGGGWRQHRDHDQDHVEDAALAR